jgi:hypothetical protein
VTVVITSYLDYITSASLLLSNSTLLRIPEWCFQFEKHFLAQACKLYFINIHGNSCSEHKLKVCLQSRVQFHSKL